MDAVTSHAWVSDLGGFPPARVARGSSSSFASRVAYFLLSFSFLQLTILSCTCYAEPYIWVKRENYKKSDSVDVCSTGGFIAVYTLDRRRPEFALPSQHPGYFPPQGGVRKSGKVELPQV